MIRHLPSAPLARALERIGLREQSQGRASLRTLVHLRTGEPPPIGASADELARTLLVTRRRKRPLR